MKQKAYSASSTSKTLKPILIYVKFFKKTISEYQFVVEQKNFK